MHPLAAFPIQTRLPPRSTRCRASSNMAFSLASPLPLSSGGTARWNACRRRAGGIGIDRRRVLADGLAAGARITGKKRSLSKMFGNRFSLFAGAVGLAVLLAATSAHAEEITPSHLAAAKQAVVVTKADRGFEDLLPSVSQQVQN